jgi:FlgD Ig-like domain/FG-GAP repeat
MKRFALILALAILPQIFGASHSAEIPEIIGIITSDTSHTLFGTQIVSLGDQNGDGYADFIISDFRFSAYMYLGGPTLSSAPFLRINSIQNRISNIGDIDGDSIPDFVSNGRGPSDWRLNAYLSGGGLDTVRDLWFGQDSLLPVGFTVNGGDINSDGSPELISTEFSFQKLGLFELREPIDSIPDFVITPQNLESNEFSAFAVGIISGDFNGDDTIDIATSFHPRFGSGELWFYWGGDAFDTIPDLIIKRPGPSSDEYQLFGRTLINLGDVNGDGYDDIYAHPGNSEDTLGFIYYCGPVIDTIPDVIFSDNTLHAAAAGDVNNDGFMDLITSFGFQANSFSWVNVYYGGANMDSLIDIRIDVEDIPGYRILWGMNVAGIGDVNGDGIDDFAVANVRNDSGQVYIFAGAGLVTDVEIIDEPSLPNDFELYQDYPNPFNPETTIEFSLVEREHVSLEVYNVLGQRVRDLVNESLSSGHYRVGWDGTDNSQKLVASGMYYYKLQVGKSFAQTKKMILLK